LVETIEVSSQLLKNATQQQQATTSLHDMAEEGDAICYDDADAVIAISPDENKNCAWLALHPASQVIFCRPDYYPLVYESCRATCNNCH
jgi:hypothetical protein